MSRRPDSLDTLALALEPLNRIPRRGRVTAADLHAQLRAAGLVRDVRTIQRQLDMLSQRFDIDRDERSKPYGYKWRDTTPGLSVPGLNRQES